VFTRNPNFWQSGLPYVDTVTVIDFPDNTSLQDALTTGVIHAAGAFDGPELAALGTVSGVKTVASHTGAITPFTMRVDQAPFNDVFSPFGRPDHAGGRFRPRYRLAQIASRDRGDEGVDRVFGGGQWARPRVR